MNRNFGAVVSHECHDLQQGAVPLSTEVGMVNLDLIEGQIVGIEVLDRPELRARVLELFP